MRSVIRDGRSAPRVADVPRPAGRAGCVLVRTMASLVSPGTERATAEFAEASLVAKAMRRPDLVRQVLAKVQRDGLLETQRAVRRRLEVADSLGYSCAGTVVEDGTGEHSPGALVACAGGGHAAHAEFNLVPRNLVARVPAGVPAEAAAFATVGSVALHGIRLARVGLGAQVGVVGLGLVGQLAAQLLAAAGCVVYALDPAAGRATLAARLAGAHTASDGEALARLVGERTRGHGLDAVIVTAAARDGGPVEVASRLARSRARVVVVGDTQLHLDRRAFYEKELQLVVSRSYGPGRYDRAYEELGSDYPYDYVRWTIQRNMEAFLGLAPRLQLDPLITHRFAIADADRAYAMLTGAAAEPHLGILLRYAQEPDDGVPTLSLPPRVTAPAGSAARLGVSLVGAGGFARSTLLPALARLGDVRPVAIVTAKGVSAWDAARRFGFATCSTELDAAAGTDTDLAVVATRHGQHASLVCELLRRGRAVFVEKPLCVSAEQLEEVRAAWRRAARPFLMVGYNRRFAPLVARLRRALAEAGRPLVLQYRVNAGSIARDSWLRDAAEGGGRTIGEACHFVDLLAHLGGAPVRRVVASRPAAGGGPDGETFVATLELANGAVGTLVYSADGDPAHPKERLEVIGGGVVAVLDDFRSLTITQRGRSRRWRTWGRDKGHLAELRATLDAVRAGGDAPIPFGEIVAGMHAVFALERAAATGEAVAVEVANG